MKWLTSVKDMPELADIPEWEKNNIIWDSSLRAYGHWQVWLGIIACMIFATLAGSIGGIPGAAIAGGAGGWLMTSLVERMKLSEIRKAVAARKAKGAA